MIGDIRPEERYCKWCRGRYEIKRIDQKFCCNNHRQRYFQHKRRRVTEDKGSLARLSRGTIQDEISQHCERTGRALLDAEPYLDALAAVKEAEELITEWNRVLHERKKVLSGMAQPRLSAKLQVIRRGESLRPPMGNQRYVGIACSSANLAVVIYGKEAENPSS